MLHYLIEHDVPWCKVKGLWKANMQVATLHSVFLSTISCYIMLSVFISKHGLDRKT